MSCSGGLRKEAEDSEAGTRYSGGMCKEAEDLEAARCGTNLDLEPGGAAPGKGGGMAGEGARGPIHGRGAPSAAATGDSHGVGEGTAEKEHDNVDATADNAGSICSSTARLKLAMQLLHGR